MDIVYPPAMTDQEKLWYGYYPLHKTLIDLHNTEGTKARDNPTLYLATGKWRQYTRRYRELIQPFHAELLSLRTSIRDMYFTLPEWKQLDLESRQRFTEDYYGLKEKLSLEKLRVSSPLLDKLKALKIDTLDRTTLADPLENWAVDYTEDDPFGVLGVAANTITITNLQRQSAARVWKDAGAAHFGAIFEHLVSGQTDSNTGGGWNTLLFFWAVANVNNADANSDPFIYLYSATNGESPADNLYMRLGIDDGATEDEDSYNAGAGEWGTRYYFTLDRNAVDLDCYIYDDVDRTNLVDTLTVPKGTSSLRYIYGTLCRGGNHAAVTSGKVYDLDLQEAPAAARRGWNSK